MENADEGHGKGQGLLMARAGKAPSLALLGLLCALPPLSIDMGLPALPRIGQAFHASATMTGLTLSLFMAGFALTPIVYGLLSDRHGRKPLMIAGLILFTLGGLGCALAPSIGWLLAAGGGRGAGAGAGPTLALAATRDRLEGPRMGQYVAWLTMILNMAPVVAPSLGAILLVLGGWRAVFGVLGTVSVLLLIAISLGFEETLAKDATAQSPAPLGGDLRRNVHLLWTRPGVAAHGAIVGLSAGSMFAYVAGSPMVVMQMLGASSAIYAAVFATTASFIVLGAFFSGRLMHGQATTRSILVAGLALTIGAPVAAGALMLAGSTTIVGITACIAVATFGFGLIVPAASHAALEPVPELAGSASAVMNSFQMVCMGLSSLGVAVLLAVLHGLAVPVVMLVFASASALCLLGVRRGAPSTASSSTQAG
jgi:DHA1 family bicyclomycin/chloramphenicol resistance-like MFS transporter